MQIYLKRQAYSQLLAWKNQPNHSTLEISGARQVGKTFLVNKFADEQYSNKIYVNLLDFSGELFLEKYEQLRNEIRNGFVCPNPVHEIVNENFVFLDLKERINHPSEIALETLAFATLGNGEIDFFVKTIESQKTYAVEVKSGKNNSKSVQEAITKGKVKYVLFAKGNTNGGDADNVYTIPIYGIKKFKF